MADKSKILVLVEGIKTDPKLMERILDVYGITEGHEVVSYGTDIYVLYNAMFGDGDPDSLDLLQLLKEREPNPEKKKLFDIRYSDILLIFDLDPQSNQFSPEKIRQMQEYFSESSDMGKLYINYPMVESFYHMKSIPDPDYYSYVVSMDELREGNYKKRVNRESKGHDYRKFAVSKSEYNMVIRQNADKAMLLLGVDETAHDEISAPSLLDVLNAQLNLLETKSMVSVLCTCVFYIIDYNPKFLMD